MRYNFTYILFYFSARVVGKISFFFPVQESLTSKESKKENLRIMEYLSKSAFQNLFQSPGIAIGTKTFFFVVVVLSAFSEKPRNIHF